MNNFNKELFFFQMFEYKVVSYYIFQKNYNSLNNYLSRIRRPIRYHHGDQTPITNKEKINVFKLHRLWHNFLASSSSLIEYTRIISKNIDEIEKIYDLESNFKNDYQKIIDKEFKDNTLHNFLKDFRNMVLHKQYSTDLNLFFQVSRTEEYNVFLFQELGPIIKSDIINSFDWSLKSKEYILEHQQNGICFYRISKEYYKKIKELHKWVDNQICEIAKAVNDLEKN